jgi:hypothetical protein
MYAATDAFFLIFGVHAERKRPFVDASEFGMSFHTHPDRCRCRVRNVEMRADCLVSRRQQPLDGLQRSCFHEINHDGRCEDVHTAAADVRRSVLLADDNFDAPVKSRLEFFYAVHGSL